MTGICLETPNKLLYFRNRVLRFKCAHTSAVDGVRNGFTGVTASAACNVPNFGRTREPRTREAGCGQRTKARQDYETAPILFLHAQCPAQHRRCSQRRAGGKNAREPRRLAIQPGLETLTVRDVRHFGLLPVDSRDPPQWLRQRNIQPHLIVRDSRHQRAALPLPQLHQTVA